MACPRTLFVCLLIGLIGCLPESDDRVPPDAVEGVDEAAPEPEEEVAINDRFRFAAVHINCDSDGAPSVTVILSDQPGCGVEDLPPDHAIVALSANDDLQFPIAAPALYRLGPDSAMGGVYTDPEGETHVIVAGRIEFDAFDPAARASGTFAFLTAGAGRVEGQYAAEVCPHDGAGPGELPACYPEHPDPPPPEEPDDPEDVPEPEAPDDPEDPEDPPDPADPERCGGTYQVTAWDFDADQSAVPPRILNDLLAGDLDSDDLLLQAHIDPDDETLQFVDAVVNADGESVPDPAVPQSPAADLNWHGRAFNFAAPSALHVQLNAADYPGAQPLVFSMFGVEFIGRFAADCSGFSGNIRGAFVNDDYTIPQPMNADVDGDGVPDGYLMVGELHAERL